METRIECADCWHLLNVVNQSTLTSEIRIRITPCDCITGKNVSDCSECEDMEILRTLQLEVKKLGGRIMALQTLLDAERERNKGLQEQLNAERPCA